MQLTDELIHLSKDDVTAKVFLTNSLGITQRIEGVEVGVVVPIELVDPPPHSTHVLVP